MSIIGIPYPKTGLLNLARAPQRLSTSGLTLAVLVGLTFLGNGLASALHLPIPGPLLGGAILVAWLLRFPAHTQTLAPADGLIAALPLLFLPLLVEAVGPLRSLGPALLPVVVTIAAATIAALGAAIVAARVAAWLCSR